MYDMLLSVKIMVLKIKPWLCLLQSHNEEEHLKVHGKNNTFPMSGLVSNCFLVLDMGRNKCPYYEVWSHCTKNGKGTVTVKIGESHITNTAIK